MLVGKPNAALSCFLLVFPVSGLSFSSLSLPSLLPSSSFPPPLFLLLLCLLSKTIKVKVIDDEEYEKNKTFYIEIGEPRLVESNDTKGQEGGWTITPGRPPQCLQRLHVLNTRRRTGADFPSAPPAVSLLWRWTCSRLWITSSHHIHHSTVRVCVCVLCAYLAVLHAFTTSLYVCVYVCVPYRKSITIRILDREEYNKQSSFYILLETPQWRRSGKEQTGVTANQQWQRTLENPESTGQSQNSQNIGPHDSQLMKDLHPNSTIHANSKQVLIM